MEGGYKAPLGNTSQINFESSSKGGARCGTSPENTSRLSKFRGNKKGGIPEFKSFNPLVFDFKTRGGEVKWRMKTDCRELNQWFTPQPFKLDHMQQILPNLKKGHWGAKVDLKDAYFDVTVHSDLYIF